MRNPLFAGGGGALEAFPCGELALTELDFGELDTTEPSQAAEPRRAIYDCKYVTHNNYAANLVFAKVLLHLYRSEINNL